MRLALFVPCFVDQLTPEVGIATAEVLERLGHEIVYPAEQTCCGQPAMNAGHFDEARRVAKRQLEVLARADADGVVAPSGSCIAALRLEARKRLGVEHPLQDRMWELSELLIDVLGVEDVGARFQGTVTWHDACHPLRELGIRAQPRRLLARVAGLDLVEMTPSDECCGFGGTFSVKAPDASVGMGERKADVIERSGAAFVASTESSCLMQIDGILRRRKSQVRAIHLAEILAGSAS